MTLEGRILVRWNLSFSAPDRPEEIATLVLTEEGNKTRLTLTIVSVTSEDRDATLRMRAEADMAQTLTNPAAYLSALSCTLRTQ